MTNDQDDKTMPLTTPLPTIAGPADGETPAPTAVLPEVSDDKTTVLPIDDQEPATMALTAAADTSNTTVMDAVDGDAAPRSDDPLHLRDVADIEPTESIDPIGPIRPTGPVEPTKPIRATAPLPMNATDTSSTIPLYTAVRSPQSGPFATDERNTPATGASEAVDASGTADSDASAAGAAFGVGQSGVADTGHSQSSAAGRSYAPTPGDPIPPITTPDGSAAQPEIIRKTGPSAATIMLGVCVLVLGVISALLGMYFPLGWILQSWTLDPRITAAIGFAAIGGILVLVAVIWSIASMISSRKRPAPEDK